jgi:DNA-binding GntR family transcriptional regulator
MMMRTPTASSARTTAPNGNATVAPVSFEPRGKLVADYLRDAILQGRVKSGEWIRQEAVARELGTSRIPVREALRQLESEGLISLVPHTGARVATRDFAEYTELYKIRERLEPLAIVESLPLLTTEDLSTLRALMVDIEATIDPVAWLDLDRRFHLMTYARAPLPRLLKMIEGFWNSTQQYRRVYNVAAAQRGDGSLFERLPMTLVEHRLLLDALERRDPDSAAETLAMHIRRTRVTLAAHAEAFDQ